MLINTTPQMRMHAAADCTEQSKAFGTWTASGRPAYVAPTAVAVKGTGMPTARTRVSAASSSVALLPFIAVVMTAQVATGNTARIRSWSPPV